MDWGLQNRISRIIKPRNNRALMLAVDHGYFLGPTEKLENPEKVIAPLLKYCDSLMVTRGVQRTSVPATTDTPMVLRVSGGSSIIGDDLSQEDITVSIEDALRLNASALAMSIFVGSKYEYQTVVNLGKLVNEATKYGLPVLAVTAVGKELGKDARYLSLACRVAAEQGAHIVKTYYCDNFEKVVQSCPVPIIVAGGKKIPERDALQLTFNAIKAGAVGVDMGRNIWQSEHPVSMIKAVREIVHGNLNVDQAFKLYQKLVSAEPKKNPNQNKSKKSNNPNQKKSKKPNNPNQNKSNNPNQNKSNNPNQNKPNNPNQNKSKKPHNPNQNKSNNPNQNKSNNPNQNKSNNPNQNKSNNPNQNKSNNPNQNKSNNPNQNKSNPPKSNIQNPAKK
jgi:3-hydroxy-5-phosphonooxypentane-2,4-dione thiolase